MMGSYDHIWAKSEMRGAVSLAMHLRQTAICAVYIAGWMGLDPRIARLGALLHDIGKASIFLTSSLRTPKFFVKEFSYFLMPCHQHGLRINLLVQR